jgi:hypothetical protein
MLAAIAALAIAAYTLNRPKPAAIKSQLPAPTKPLFKPQPIDLINRKDLHLSNAQVEQITKFNNEWRTVQRRVMNALNEFEPKKGTKEQVAAQMQEYSKLSREYDEAREKAWKSSLAVLDSSQRALAEKEIGK